MLIAASLFLALLTVVNYRCGKSPLYPPFVWSFAWTVNLLLLDTAGERFYPVSWGGSVGIYVLGALLFSLGGTVALMLPMGDYLPSLRPASSRVRALVRRALNVLLIGAISFFPFYLQFLRAMAGSYAGAGNFWERMRRGSMIAENMPTGGPFLVAPLIVQLISILAMIAVYEEDGRWSGRTIAFAAVATFYELISGARSELTLLLVALIAISYFKKHRLPIKGVAAFLCMFLILFAVFQIKMEKMGAKADAPLSYNLPLVGQNLEAYSIGSLVAFDQIAGHPGFISNDGMLNKFFIRLANRFGAEIVPEPSRHLQYVNISSGTAVNTYTIYFAFGDYGWAEIAAAMALLGGVTTLFFRYSLRRSAFATIVFSTGLFAILMSGFSEEFFAQIGLCVKAFCLILLLYRVLPSVYDAFASRWSSSRTLHPQATP